MNLQDKTISVSDERYTLDPQVQALLNGMAQTPQPSYASLGPVQARQHYRQSRLALQAAPVRVAAVQALTAICPAGPLAMRLYRPILLTGSPSATPLPCVIFFHGGGWVLGDLDTHDRLCRALAQAGQVRSGGRRLPAGARTPLSGGRRGRNRDDEMDRRAGRYPGA